MAILYADEQINPLGNSMKHPSVFGLVCAGGGAHGAYQVGVLKYIHEHFPSGEASPFQIFTGSSCGSLNTSFYAAQSFDARKSRLWLEELWMGFHVPVYHGNMVKNIALSLYKQWRKQIPDRDYRSPWSLLDPTPMRNVIREGFLRNNLIKSLTLGTTEGFAVATTELLSGRACWFIEGKRANSWNLFHSLSIVDSISNNHVAASCSVPIFLPPVKIGDRYYLDGSISLGHPLSAAISMGATRIISIATQKKDHRALPEYRENFKPRITNVIRLLLNRLSYDAAFDEAAQLDMLNRFYHSLSKKNRHFNDNVQRIPLFHEEALPKHYQPVEVYLFQPSKRIDYTSVTSENPSNPFASQKKTSRFMFHEKFIRELINLGYADAKAQHDDLDHFFHPKKEEGRLRSLIRTLIPKDDLSYPEAG